MTGLAPGRIVYYVFDDAAAAEVTRRRTTGASIAERIKAGDTTLGEVAIRAPLPAQWPIGAQAHIGNPVRAGDICPAMIVATFPAEEQDQAAAGVHVNLQVFLDGCDVYWARLVPYAEWSGDAEEVPTPGTWHWMFAGQASRYTPTPPPA